MPFGPTILSPAWLVPGLLLAAWLLWRRKPGLAGVAMLLAIAMAGPAWRWRADARVAVFVDLSPSTRGASWRNPDELRRLLDQVPGNVEELHVFGEATSSLDLSTYDGRDVPARATRLAIETGADAAVIVTDGRLSLTSATTTFFVVDPAMDRPDDLAAVRLERDADRLIRQARVDGENRGDVAAGERSAVRFSVGDGTDRWPENDTLFLPAAVEGAFRKVSIGGVVNGFDPLSNITLASLRDVAVAVIVGAVEDESGAALARFVTDFGGNLVWANPSLPPGSMRGVLPLSFVPPESREPWTFVVDVSGSTAGQSRAFAAAVASAAAALPEATPVDVLAFSDQITRLASGTPASELLIDLPAARGPTGLDAAVAEAVVGQGRQVLLITDGSAEVAESTASALAADIMIHLVSPGGEATESVLRLVQASGGTMVVGENVAALARDLVGTAAAGELRQDPARLVVDDIGVDVAPWREAWLRDRASPAGVDGEVPAAVWRVGAGRVAAVPARVSDALIQKLVGEEGGGRPADVRWDDGRDLIVTVGDAAEAERVELIYDGRRIAALPTSASTWQATLSGRRRPGVAVVLVDGVAVARKTLAGRFESRVRRGRERPPAS